MTWPAVVPEGRSYVVDGLERVVMDGDYLPVLESLDCDTVVVEWDLAVDPEMIAAFTAACEAEPSWVRVAPYRLYGVREVPVWAHQSAWHFHPVTRWSIADGEPDCSWFALGLTYLPLAIVRAFIESGPPRPVTDKVLSDWHFAAGYGLVPVEWGVRPVHLHY